MKFHMITVRNLKSVTWSNFSVRNRRLLKVTNSKRLKLTAKIKFEMMLTALKNLFVFWN